jgi:Family of unknown function (DUF6082)
MSSSRKIFVAEAKAARARATIRRVTLVASISLVAVVGLGLVLTLPLLLQRFDAIYGLNWPRLSEIGQTFGAASAILSALALGGIGISLFLQAGQAKADRIQSIREFHLELLQMTIGDLELFGPCLGSFGPPTLDGKRQHLFMVIVMNYAWMGYESGTISEQSLRGEVLKKMFQGEIGRQYWNEIRPIAPLARRGTRRSRRFFEIVQEEYDEPSYPDPLSSTERSI